MYLAIYFDWQRKEIIKKIKQMKIQLKRIDNDYHFELKNERGHVTHIDSKAAVGGHDLAPSPMEYVLMGVAGCLSLIHI